MFLGSVVEQKAVVHATKVSEFGVLHGDDIVTAGTELLSDGRGLETYCMTVEEA